MEKKILDLIMMSSEIMVTMVGLFTVQSGTTVTKVCKVMVPSSPTATIVGFITVQSGKW